MTAQASAASRGKLAAAEGRLRRAVRLVAAEPLGALGLAVILLFAFAGIFAPIVAPYDPQAANPAALLAPPSAAHWFGTDSFGRDIFSRIVYGARTALVVGFASAFLGCTIGALIGAASAYFGGLFDTVVQRLIEILLALPIVVVALVVVSVLGRRLVGGVDVNLILAIAIPIVPNVTRVIRASVLPLRSAAFVDAARVAGYGDARIILRHILPNITAPYLILLTNYLAQAILLEAGLSFLGLGVSEPTPAWGLMLSGSAADFYREAPWMILFPGLAITASVLAFNMLGDSLRDRLDPKFQK